MTTSHPGWRFSVAPMLDWTDRHCRTFHRALTRRALLYTEMVTTGALIHGDRARHLDFGAHEQPVALQLGGSNPADLAACARMGEAWGYVEINLNCGCPSDRVQNGAFGACLMREPARVAASVAAMKAAVSIPVTVKCRIGVDDQEPRAALFDFAAPLRAAGVDALIVHARKAWLQGLSPRENRDVPPLDYPLVRELKRAMPDLPIAINGGLANLAAMQAQLAPEGDAPALDGVMVGRAAYQEPEWLGQVDPLFFGRAAPHADPRAALEAFLPYVEAQLAEGVRLSDMTRHILGLFHGRPGARKWRRHLSTHAVRRGAGLEVVREALSHVGFDDGDRNAA
jgi:tRNA-dihydrouridine synthase A